MLCISSSTVSIGRMTRGQTGGTTVGLEVGLINDLFEGLVTDD